MTPYQNSPDNAFHKIIGFLLAGLAFRLKNKGMEGLTITPDGSTLVGMMQSALQQPDLGSTKAGNVAATRIITINLHTLQSGELLGNFPQAFSHIGLVNAAWAISEAELQARDELRHDLGR